jgi:hypothetical protein
VTGTDNGTFHNFPFRQWLVSVYVGDLIEGRGYSAAAKTLRCIRGPAIFWQLSDQQRTSQNFIPSWLGSD